MLTTAPKTPTAAARPTLTGKPTIHPPKGAKRPNTQIRTKVEFAATHRDDADRLRKYAGSNRRGYVRPDPDVMRFIEPCYAGYLRANNAEARILFAEKLSGCVREHVAPDADKLLFVTVTPRAYILPFGSAADVQLNRLKAFARQAIGNSNGIGMIEAALFRDCDDYGPCWRSEVVSWHIHIIVWGKTHAELRAIADRLGPQHVNISGRNPVWIQSITPEELDLYVLYLAKTPLKTYRLKPVRDDTIDEKTGEVFNRLKQSKDRMRTGDTMRMANLMKDMFLPQLVIGSGAGTKVIRDLVHDVTRLHRREKAREDQLRALQRRPHSLPGQ